MVVLAWFGVAVASQTDCVTKDLGWRWLSTTADAGDAGAKAGDLWSHGAKVVLEQAPGASGRLSWKPDDASKVAFHTGASGGDLVETFKWNVTLSATDGKPIAPDVSDTELKLTMHCMRTTGGAVPAPAPAAPKPAPAAAAPKPAPAAAVPKPAPAPAPAKAPAPAPAKAPGQ